MCQSINRLPSFNRTIVELKHTYDYRGARGGATFNRTIVELKLNSSRLLLISDLPFNRTIVELKRCSNRRLLEHSPLSLLIEPLWN